MNIINRTAFNNVLFAIFVVINILDFYTTKMLVDMWGIEIEGNPIVLFAMTLVGATWAMLAVKTLVLVPLLVFINYSKESFNILTPDRVSMVMYVVITALGLIVISNFILILLS